MKQFAVLLILVIFGASFVIFLVQNAYGLWIPEEPETLMEKSHMIFVGKITSVDVVEVEKSRKHTTEKGGIEKETIENYTINLEEYTVSIEESVKNRQNLDTIQVRQPTIGLPGGERPHVSFELGDRVLFYLPNDFRKDNTYASESCLIESSCTAEQISLVYPIDRNITTASMTLQDVLLLVGLAGGISGTVFVIWRKRRVDAKH